MVRYVSERRTVRYIPSERKYQTVISRGTKAIQSAQRDPRTVSGKLGGTTPPPQTTKYYYTAGGKYSYTVGGEVPKDALQISQAEYQRKGISPSTVYKKGWTQVSPGVYQKEKESRQVVGGREYEYTRQIKGTRAALETGQVFTPQAARYLRREVKTAEVTRVRAAPTAEAEDRGTATTFAGALTAATGVFAPTAPTKWRFGKTKAGVQTAYVTGAERQAFAPKPPQTLAESYTRAIEGSGELLPAGREVELRKGGVSTSVGYASALLPSWRVSEAGAFVGFSEQKSLKAAGIDAPLGATVALTPQITWFGRAEKKLAGALGLSMYGKPSEAKLTSDLLRSRKKYYEYKAMYEKYQAQPTFKQAVLTKKFPRYVLTLQKYPELAGVKASIGRAGSKYFMWSYGKFAPFTLGYEMESRQYVTTRPLSTALYAGGGLALGAGVGAARYGILRAGMAIPKLKAATPLLFGGAKAVGAVAGGWYAGSVAAKTILAPTPTAKGRVLGRQTVMAGAFTIGARLGTSITAPLAKRLPVTGEAAGITLTGTKIQAKEVTTYGRITKPMDEGGIQRVYLKYLLPKSSVGAGRQPVTFTTGKFTGQGYKFTYDTRGVGQTMAGYGVSSARYNFAFIQRKGQLFVQYLTKTGRVVKEVAMPAKDATGIIGKLKLPRRGRGGMGVEQELGRSPTKGDVKITARGVELPLARRVLIRKGSAFAVGSQKGFLGTRRVAAKLVAQAKTEYAYRAKSAAQVERFQYRVGETMYRVTPSTIKFVKYRPTYTSGIREKGVSRLYYKKPATLETKATKAGVTRFYYRFAVSQPQPIKRAVIPVGRRLARFDWKLAKLRASKRGAASLIPTKGGIPLTQIGKPKTIAVQKPTGRIPRPKPSQFLTAEQASFIAQEMPTSLRIPPIMFEKTRQRIRYDASIREGVRSRLREVSRAKTKPMLKITPDVATELQPITVPKVRQRTRTEVRTIPSQEIITRTKIITEPITGEPPPITPTTPPPPPPTELPLFRFGLPSLRIGWGARRGYASEFRPKYRPSVEAVALNIRGVKPPKMAIKAGIGLRPIIGR